MTRFSFADFVEDWINQSISKGYRKSEISAVLETAAARVSASGDDLDHLVDLGSGAEEIFQERARQLAKFRDQNVKDDTLENGELIEAAICYLRPDAVKFNPPARWPLGPSGWNPRSKRENLVRAGAFIAAELDRMERSGES